MGFINKFFNIILEFQKEISEFEETYRKINIKKYVIFSFILLMVSVFSKSRYFMIGAFLNLIFLLVIDSCLGWRNSIRRFLILGIFINMVFCVIFIDLSKNVLEKYDLFFNGVTFAVFSLIWSSLSLMATTDVAKLTNEIISGISTLIFTVGTYLIGIEISKYPSIDNIMKIFNNDYDKFEFALENGDKNALLVLKLEGLNFMQNYFVKLVPIIGLSTICIMILSIKQYWLKKIVK